MPTQHTTHKNDRQQHSRTAKSQHRSGGTEQLVGQAQRYLEKGNERLREVVEDHEGQTVLIALALGFGVGVAIGYAVGGPPQSSTSRWIDRATAEGVGRKLLERIDQMLPTAITNRLHG